MRTKTVQKEMLRKGMVMLPVRITHKQNIYLKEYVQRGMFSSRQEAIRFFISEKMQAVTRIRD